MINTSNTINASDAHPSITKFLIIHSLDTRLNYTNELGLRDSYSIIAMISFSRIIASLWLLLQHESLHLSKNIRGNHALVSPNTLRMTYSLYMCCYSNHEAERIL